MVYAIATGAGQASAADYTPALTGSVDHPGGRGVRGRHHHAGGRHPGGGQRDGDADPVRHRQLRRGPGRHRHRDHPGQRRPNQPPTAVTLQNTVTALSEAADVSSGVRLADISVTDDGLGTNSLSVGGPDAASFEIVGSSLYLKAGVSLSHATRPILSVTVQVDDPTVGGSPDATVDFTLAVTQAVAPGAIVISEVAPWSSSSSPLAADWFEVTNTGTAPSTSRAGRWTTTRTRSPTRWP